MSLDAELLLAHAFGTSRARLRAHPEEMADATKAKRYAQYIDAPCRGEPLAYIIGRKDFWSLRLAITPRF